MLKRCSRQCRSLFVSLGVPLGVSLVAFSSASCQSRRFNFAGAKSARPALSPDSFSGVLFQVKAMSIWATFDYANDALKWVLSKPDFKEFVASEWAVKPYGSSRFDFLIQPRGEMAAAYKGSDFDMDMRALAGALEANFRFAPGDVQLEDGSVIKGKAATKVTIVLKDGLDHGEPNFKRDVPLPWELSRRLGTDDPEWARTFVRVPEAWAHLEILGRKPGEGVTIGVIDTGVLPHPVLWGKEQVPPQLDLSGAATFESTDATLSERLKSRSRGAWKDEAWTRLPALSPEVFKAVDVYSFNAAPANPGHGTAVVSILSGVGKESPVERNNPNTYGQGIVPSARIVPVRVGPSTVVLDPEPMAKAFRHLTAHGADIITVSLGGVPGVDLHEAVIEAYKKGIIITAAAGNGLPFVVWPAAYKEAIAVGAGDIHCKAWSKSSPGAKVEILAPGDEVWYAASFFDKRLYEQRGNVPASDALVYAVKRGQGTSFATPHVASAAALWLSKFGAANVRAHYRAQVGKHSDDRYVSLAFRYLMSRPGGHTLCPGGDRSRMRRDAGGAYLNMLSLLNNEFARFPTKAQLDDFEVGGLREQESYDLAITALITIATGIPDIFARREHHEDDFSLLPEGVRSQLITIFKEKVSDARAAFNRGR